MKTPSFPASLVLLGLVSCTPQPSGPSSGAASYGLRSLSSKGQTPLPPAPAREFRSSGAPAPSKPSASRRPLAPSPSPAPRRIGGPISFGSASSASASGRYRLAGSGSTLVLTNASGTRLGTLTLPGERAVRIKPGRGDNFLVVTSGGSIVKASASGGRLSQTAKTPALPSGVVADLLEGKDGSVHVVSRSGGKVEVNSLRGGAWRPNRAVSSSLSSFQTMKLDPSTGEIAFLGKAPGSNRLAIIRSNSTGSSTESFLLPEGMNLVNDIAVVNGEVYVASGRGKNATLSVFGADGRPKGTIVTGEISSLNVTYQNGRPVIQAAGSNGAAMTFDASKPIDKQAPAGSEAP